MDPRSGTPHRDWLYLSARLFLGGLFIYASADKILKPADFARAVYNYQILPDGLINPAALVLPWLELLLGLCLVSGKWMFGAMIWSNGLLWAFFLALLFNRYRGLDVHCGCFSTRLDPADTVPTVWYLLRDAFFLIVAGYLMFRQVTVSKAAASGKRKT
jgi:uncharacterized membrane protein YphA (DoxX/SURF4 family)